jgi:hypothetical protein
MQVFRVTPKGAARDVMGHSADNPITTTKHTKSGAGSAWPAIFPMDPRCAAEVTDSFLFSFFRVFRGSSKAERSNAKGVRAIARSSLPEDALVTAIAKCVDP